MKSLERVVLPLLAACLLSGLVSLYQVLADQELTLLSLLEWLDAWPLVFVVVLPCVLVATPLFKRLRRRKSQRRPTPGAV